MSPQPLQPKIRGQATPADPYAGWGMSAAQNDLPAPLDFIRTLVKKFTNPNDPMGPMAMEAPIGAGLAISERNIPVILKRLQELEAKQTDSPQQFAIKYIAAKYPKLFSLPDQISTVNPADLGPLQAGSYYPSSNSIELSSHPGYSRMQAVGTLAHEITHALQSARGESFNGYIPASSSISGYLDQPTEVGARQAGKTAQTTMQKFIKMAVDYVRDNPQGKL